MFTARRGRTLLTILGMGIGFGAILFLVCLGYGLQNALIENITTSGALVSLDVLPNEQEGKILTREAARDMEKIDGVEKIEASYNFSGRIKFGDVSSDAQAVVASREFLNIEGVKIAEGKPFDPENPKQVLISSSFEKIFGRGPAELIGQKISFSLFVPAAAGEGAAAETDVDLSGYEIVGIAKSEEAIFWTSGRNIEIPEGAAYAKIKVQCASSESMGPVKDGISQMGFSVSSLSETIAEVNKLFRVINIVLGLFGIVTLSVSAIGMFNTMTVALLERTREIGIMRSIGASRSDIMRMFVIESTLMGLCGGIAGVVIGVLSGAGVNFAVGTAAKYFGGNRIDIFAYPLWFLGTVLLFSLVIGLITGIGPAKRASSLDPLEALRSR